ncbi:hypothetical protein CHU98_g1606 [Xylaria longipes]|nr:hypothetical protein CHU98_g1606 [Xylaria longipes]
MRTKPVHSSEWEAWDGGRGPAFQMDGSPSPGSRDGAWLFSGEKEQQKKSQVHSYLRSSRAYPTTLPLASAPIGTMSSCQRVARPLVQSVQAAQSIHQHGLLFQTSASLARSFSITSARQDEVPPTTTTTTATADDAGARHAGACHGRAAADAARRHDVGLAPRARQSTELC